MNERGLIEILLDNLLSRTRGEELRLLTISSGLTTRSLITTIL